MSDVVFPLWSAAAALYAWECLVAVPRDGFVLESRGGAFGVKLGRELPGTASSGYRFTNPLPAAALMFVLGGAPGGDRHVETDFRAVRRRLEQVRREVLAMNVLGAVSFALLFVVLPISEAMRFFPAVAPWLLGAVLLGHMSLLVLRVRSLRRLGLRSSRFETLLFAASPLMSMRAGSAVATRAFEGYEPLAVAFVLSPAREFLELCHEFVGRGALGVRATGVLRAAGVDAAQLDGHAFVEDETAKSFCPRCRSFFTIAGGPCPDCGSPLAALDESRRRAARRIVERVEQRHLELSR